MSADDQPLLPLSKNRRTMVTSLTMMAMIVQTLDSTICNVALPHMQASLGATQETIKWVLTSYIISAAIIMPTSGWLSNQIGLRKLLLISMLGFTLSSMACGFAWSLPSMIIFRVLQGIFGAALLPLSQTLLFSIFPRHQHGYAMGLFGTGTMIGPIMGPMLGGWLTDNMSWHWVFFINLPIGLIAFAGMAAFLPHLPRQRRPFDLFGFAFLALGIASLQLLLDRGEHIDWFHSVEAWVELGLGITGLWIFAIHMWTSPNALLPRQIFRDRNFNSALILTFCQGIFLFSTAALIPVMLQQVYHYPVFESGELVAVRGVGTMLSMIIVSRMITRVPAQLLLLLGYLITIFSFWWLSRFAMVMDGWVIGLSGFVQGWSMGFMFVPLTTIAFSTLPAEYRAEAASFSSLTRQFGASIGISYMVTLLGQNVQVAHANIGAHVSGESLPVIDPVMLQALGDAGVAAIMTLDQEINRQALLIAYNNDFLLMMWISILTMPLILMLRKTKGAPKADAPLPMVDHG